MGRIRLWLWNRRSVVRAHPTVPKSYSLVFSPTSGEALSQRLAGRVGDPPALLSKPVPTTPFASAAPRSRTSNASLPAWLETVLSSRPAAGCISESRKQLRAPSCERVFAKPRNPGNPSSRRASRFGVATLALRREQFGKRRRTRFVHAEYADEHEPKALMPDGPNALASKVNNPEAERRAQE